MISVANMMGHENEHISIYLISIILFFPNVYEGIQTNESRFIRLMSFQQKEHSLSVKTLSSRERTYPTSWKKNMD